MLLKSMHLETRGMTQWWEVHSAPAEDLRSLPTTDIGTYVYILQCVCGCVCTYVIKHTI